MSTPEMISQRIRVLIVEDSPTESLIIKRIIANAPGFEVVGTAANGEEGLDLLIRTKPDVVCTDYYMPTMNGLEFIKKATQIYLCPILVLSAGVQSYQTDNIFNLLSAGAVDVIPKPIHGNATIDEKKLLNKLKTLAKIGHTTLKSKITSSDPNHKKIEIIGIGASTGGPQAFEKILPELSANLSAPIVCVQHMSLGFIHQMAKWLDNLCKINVQVASDGTKPEPGHVYFAPDGYHLELDNNKNFKLVEKQEDEEICPSVDHLFSSLASQYGSNAVAILLSGMGKDGAVGMRAVNYAGGITIAQNQESSLIFGMPKAAIDAGATRYVLPLNEIPAKIIELGSHKA